MGFFSFTKIFSKSSQCSLGISLFLLLLPDSFTYLFVCGCFFNFFYILPPFFSPFLSSFLIVSTPSLLLSYLHLLDILSINKIFKKYLQHCCHEPRTCPSARVSLLFPTPPIHMEQGATYLLSMHLQLSLPPGKRPQSTASSVLKDSAITQQSSQMAKNTFATSKEVPPLADTESEARIIGTSVHRDLKEFEQIRGFAHSRTQIYHNPAWQTSLET